MKTPFDRLERNAAYLWKNFYAACHSLKVDTRSAWIHSTDEKFLWPTCRHPARPYAGKRYFEANISFKVLPFHIL